MNSYSLRVYNSILAGAGYIDDISADAGKWKRSIRADGGFWMGTFTLSADLGELERWFYGRLGYHLQEKVSSKETWEGQIYSMDLYRGKGLRGRRRTLDKMYNSLNSTYMNATTVAETGWTENAQSIARYGKRQEWIGMDNFSLDSANRRLAVLLKENAWPWPRTLAARNDAPRLEVTACGYVFTGNWRFTTVSMKTPVDTYVSDYIQAMVQTDCAEFLSVGKITPNTIYVRAWVDTPQRTWDQISEMTDLGDVNGSHWRCYVGPGRKVYYEPVDVTPLYEERGNGLELIGGGTPNPWEVRPGVVRDMTYPAKNDEPGSFLLDHRDSYIGQVEVNDQGEITLTPSDDLDELDIVEAQQDYAQKIKEIDMDLED